MQITTTFIKNIINEYTYSYLLCSKQTTHKYMLPFLIQNRKTNTLFNIFTSLNFLLLAGKYIKEMAQQNKHFLFINTEEKLKGGNAVVLPYCSYINHKWFSGLLTNWQTTNQQIKKLVELTLLYKVGYFQRKQKRRSFEKKLFLMLQKRYTGLTTLFTLPDVIIFLTSEKETAIFKEALQLGIPIVGILHNFQNPFYIPYPIFINNTSVLAIQFIFNYLITQVILGQSLAV